MRRHSPVRSACLLLLAPLLFCDTGLPPPPAENVTATLQRALDKNPSSTCSEFQVLSEAGSGATFHYYMVEASCDFSQGMAEPQPVRKFYELCYTCVSDGWRLDTIREVDESFAHDPSSGSPAPFTAHPWVSRQLLWILGIPTGLILAVLILWLLLDRFKTAPAAARRLRLSQKTRQPHQSKHFDSINPLD